MKNIDQIACKMISSAPRLTIRGYERTLTPGTISSKGEEAYALTMHQHKVIVDAHSTLGAIQAVHAVADNMNQDSLYAGIEQRARFNLRPLWLHGDVPLGICEGVYVHVPNYLALDSSSEEIGSTIVKRLIELGYNALVIGELTSCKADQASILKKRAKCDDVFTDSFLKDKAPENELQKCFINFCAALRGGGIKVILKLKFEADATIVCPNNSHWQDKISGSLFELKQDALFFDALFIESNFQHKDFLHKSFCEGMTAYDVVLSELRTYEKIVNRLNVSLIYYLPVLDAADANKQMRWLPQFIEDAHINTKIAFSVVAGHPSRLDLQEHPIWEYINGSAVLGHISLMPIINAGSVNMGNGLWPILPLSCLDILSNANLGRFIAGAICLTSYLPLPGSVLDAALWMAVKLQWQMMSPRYLLMKWLEKWGEDAPLDRFSKTTYFELCSNIAKDLSYIKNIVVKEHNRERTELEEVRLRAETMLANLKWLQHIAQQFHKKSAANNLNRILADFTTYFCRDARRIVLHYLQSYNINLPQVLSGDDTLESFWTELPQTGGNGFNAASKVTFRDFPNLGLPESKLHHLYKSTHLLAYKEKG